MGAHISNAQESDPEITNAFLKHVLDFEHRATLPKIPIRSLFPKAFSFPKVKSMTPEQIEAKLDDILDILEDHNVGVELCGEVPPSVVYSYLVDQVIANEMIDKEMGEGEHVTFTGCTGDCQGCFQREYCDIKEDEEEFGGNDI